MNFGWIDGGKEGFLHVSGLTTYSGGTVHSLNILLAFKLVSIQHSVDPAKKCKIELGASFVCY